MKIFAAHRHAAGFGLDQERIDARAVHHDAGGERMKQHIDLARGEEIVGRAFIGRGVVSLRLGLAEDQMRLVETAERVDAAEQIVGDAVHDLADIAVHIGVQPAEIGHAGGSAHAAEEPVALDQQRLAPERAGGGGRGDAGRPAARTTTSNSPKIGVSRAGSVMLGKTGVLPKGRSIEPPLYSGCGTPSTRIKFRLKPASRKASACAYSGERYQRRAVSRSGNSAMMNMRGDQVPSSASTSPPRTR